ncbi:DUF4844 domain-containing protein [Pelagibaculum spongiae]|uniref:DUF4844 domain-containing protein n=1 Tax=Pelagibaculum spongiae TaxID=2080658 RepID=UPI001314A597|nr:DUF4844 domain-containing protein [Pelagibaculum spongiae]
MDINSHAIQALQVLRQQEKFIEDKQLFYSGAPDEATRKKVEAIINKTLYFLIAAKSEQFTEAQFWAVLEFVASQFASMDSEEMDRALGYMEQMMQIVGIESSQGRLNEWRYRFDPEVLW